MNLSADCGYSGLCVVTLVLMAAVGIVRSPREVSARTPGEVSQRARTD
jgi:hypothetical protein